MVPSQLHRDSDQTLDCLRTQYPSKSKRNCGEFANGSGKPQSRGFHRKSNKNLYSNSISNSNSWNCVLRLKGACQSSSDDWSRAGGQRSRLQKETIGVWHRFRWFCLSHGVSRINLATSPNFSSTFSENDRLDYSYLRRRYLARHLEVLELRKSWIHWKS